MRYVSIVGTGFVADLYMQSLTAFGDIAVRSVFDRNPRRLAEFSSHWKVRASESLDTLLASSHPDDLILNLTNPSSHFEVNLACLSAGHHVYSEKPLALEMSQAFDLYTKATENNLLLGSAPCSVLGEACQTLWRAVREECVGRPRLVYAELDDGFVYQAPYRAWRSASGAPWPYEDEFVVGCTIEHAGYYLGWLIAIFGPVRSVTAASANLVTGLGVRAAAPDFSVAVLFFEGGVVARLTCSIVARHDHSIRIIGEAGTLEVEDCWDNESAVRVRYRRTIRRRLIELPFARRLRLRQPTHPKVHKFGAASMNFALGPAEMLNAIAENRPSRVSAEFALHLNEVTLAIHNSRGSGGAIQMVTTCPPMDPQDWAKGPLR